MSIDRQTLEFLDTLNRDSAMQSGFDDALSSASNPLQAAVEFAMSRGYAVTAAGLDAAKQALTAMAELNESELDAVAGGFNPQPELPARISSGDLRSLRGQFNTRLLRW